jgi:hypothetical protein
MASFASESLLAAMVFVVVACLIVAVVAIGRRPAHEAPPAAGRVRLPVRAFERLAFSALLLGAAAIVAASAVTDGLVVAAVVVGGALVWLARRGAFAALASAEHGDHDG